MEEVVRAFNWVIDQGWVSSCARKNRPFVPIGPPMWILGRHPPAKLFDLTAAWLPGVRTQYF